MSKISSLSLTISEDRITSVLYHESDSVVSIFDSSVSCDDWDCFFDEDGIFTCVNAPLLDNGILYLQISPSGYMRIYIDNITFPKVDNFFLSVLQILFRRKRIYLWKGNIIPKEAKSLNGSLSIASCEETHKLYVCFSYIDSKYVMRTSPKICTSKEHALTTRIDIIIGG
jgi:hypothetical protein